MLEYFQSGGINTYDNPLLKDGQLIHGLNIVSFPNGGKTKRPGYYNFFPNSNLGAPIQSLFSFGKQDGTTLYLYAAAGSQLYYSAQGTANFAVCGNGTIAANSHVGHAVFNNVLIIGDGVGSTRHTSSGTAFTNTTLAPVAQYLSQFHNRIYASDGTSSVFSYSVANDATNWQSGGTSDSSSFVVPDEGAIKNHFVAGNRLVITKSRGKMFSWDDYSLIDMTTRYGASSPYSIANIDENWFYINQFGLFGFDGANRQLLSNPIQRQFYNYDNTGIGYAVWGTAVGETHYWDYLVSVGNVTDNFTKRPMTNTIIKYDSQKDEFLNWSFANTPTAMHSFFGDTNYRALFFGDTIGNIYKFDPGNPTDDGAPIPTEMVYFYNYSVHTQTLSAGAAQEAAGGSYEKKWNWYRGFFNPGCEVSIQFAFSNHLNYQDLTWSEVINTGENKGDFWQFSDGVVEIRFPMAPENLPRSRYLFVRIYESSVNSLWTYYGCQIDADVQVIK